MVFYDKHNVDRAEKKIDLAKAERVIGLLAGLLLFY
jgi:hypothetical protein